MSPRRCRRRHRSITGSTSFKGSAQTLPITLHPPPALLATSPFPSPPIHLSIHSRPFPPVPRLSADEDDKLHPALTLPPPTLHTPPPFPPLMPLSLPLAFFLRSKSLCYCPLIFTLPRSGAPSFCCCVFMSPHSTPSLPFSSSSTFPLLSDTKPPSLSLSPLS